MTDARTLPGGLPTTLGIESPRVPVDVRIRERDGSRVHPVYCLHLVTRNVYRRVCRVA